MYHDEFARRPERPASGGEDLIPGLAMEVGGGLTLALAASFSRPASLLLYSLGGLLPLVAACASIAARRAAALRFIPIPSTPGMAPSVFPVPYSLSRSASMAGKPRHRRVGSDR